MIFGIEPLIFWGWLFLSFYIGMMLMFGIIGMRKVKDSDDFATARGGYGPIFLAFAMTATAASGATFLGLPGLAYTSGFSVLWYAIVYPLGVYTGVLICLHAVRKAGASFGSRSMPEFLGDRFNFRCIKTNCGPIFHAANGLLSWAIIGGEQ